MMHKPYRYAQTNYYVKGDVCRADEPSISRFEISPSECLKTFKISLGGGVHRPKGHIVEAIKLF
jgi:hypothetical protein